MFSFSSYRKILFGAVLVLGVGSASQAQQVIAAHSVMPEAASLPYLGASSVLIGQMGEYRAGERAFVRFQWSAFGERRLSSEVCVRLYLSSDAYFDHGDELLAEVCAEARFAVGEYATLVFDLPEEMDAGRYHLLAVGLGGREVLSSRMHVLPIQVLAALP